MAGTCVIYNPPTTNYPYLVVTFPPDRSLQATPFDSEEEASAFIDRVAPRGLRYGTHPAPAGYLGRRTVQTPTIHNCLSRCPAAAIPSSGTTAVSQKSVSG
jgi:hypothetical protein